MTNPDHDALLLKGTEIYDTDIPRVDAVRGPATGIPFLIMKSADSPSADPLRKADAMADEIVASDVETPIVQGSEVNPDKAGDADMPGSPTWEAVDAATARAAISQIVSLRALVNGLVAREQAEGATDNDGDDFCWDDSSWDLQDAASQLDFVLSVLAKFAVNEQDEADTAAQEAEDSARAMGLIKALRSRRSEVLKAGRVLSATNEATLRSMSEQLIALLAQVDTAPVAAEGGEAVSVAKAQDPSTPLPLALTALLSQLAVAYTAWEADGTAPATPDPTVAAPDPAADPAPVDPAATDTTGDPMTPAPTAPAPAVADPNLVAKSDDKTDVEKSIEARIEAKVAEHLAAIEKRLQTVESTPVNAGPMLNGQTPAGFEAATGTPAEQLVKQMGSEQDPAKRMDAIATLIASGQLDRI